MPRFAPSRWVTNFPNTMKADIITPIGSTDEMTLSMECHDYADLTGFLWYSKADIRHPLLRYGLRPATGDTDPDKVRVSTETDFWTSPGHPDPSYPTLRAHTSIFNQEKTRDYRGLTIEFDIELIGDIDLIDKTGTKFTSPKVVIEKWLDPDIEPNVALSDHSEGPSDVYATAFAVYPPELISFNSDSVATVVTESEDPASSQRYRKAHVSINLDTVVPDGSDAALDARSIDKIGIQVVPKDYGTSTGAFGATGPVRGQVKITNFTVTVSNEATGQAVLDKGYRAVRGHHMRVAIGYEDDYNVTPESLLEDQQAIGHRGPLVDYVGRGKHYALKWNASANGGLGAYEVDPTRVLNDTATEWHTNLFARAKTLNRPIVVSVAFEVLLNDCPSGWNQLNTDKIPDGSEQFFPAATGWDPPSTLLSPCNADAVGFIGDTLKAFLALQPAEAELYFQIGEPWWWDQSFSVAGVNEQAGHPCYYDFQTKTAWFNEFGDVIPVMLSSSQADYPPDDHPPGYADITWRDVWDWLADKLGTAIETIRDDVKATYPDALGTFLIFPPQVFGAHFTDADFEETDFPITRYTNWSQSHIEASNGWDFCQAEAYDWIADGPGSLYTPPAPRFDLYNDPTYGIRALFTNPPEEGKPFLGFDLDTQYWEFCGYVAAEGFAPATGVPETHEEFLARRREEWKDISRVAAEAQSAGATQVVIWAWTQEKRDGWVWTGDAQMANLLVMNGPTPPSGKTISANSSLDVVLLGKYGGYPREHNAVWDVTNECWKPKGDGTIIPDDGTPFYIPGANTGDARPPQTQFIVRLRFTDDTEQNYEFVQTVIASSTNQWEWGYEAEGVTYVEGTVVSASNVQIVGPLSEGDGGAFDATDRTGGTASHYNFTMPSDVTQIQAVYRVQGGEMIALTPVTGYVLAGNIIAVLDGHKPNSGEEMMFFYV